MKPIGLSELSISAKKKEAENKKFFARLKKLNPKNLDVEVKTLHKEAFENIVCLECANCCKSISPVITDKDIERIAKHLRLRPAAFTEKYLHLDEDNDYVFDTTPCPFLMNDNYCIIYDVKPRACAGYPHTDRKNFIQLLDLTIKNMFICPAAYDVVEKLKESFAARY